MIDENDQDRPQIDPEDIGSLADQFLKNSAVGKEPDLKRKEVTGETPEEQQYEGARKKLDTLHALVVNAVKDDPRTEKIEFPRGAYPPDEYILELKSANQDTTFKISAESDDPRSGIGRWLNIERITAVTSDRGPDILTRKYTVYPGGAFNVDEQDQDPLTHKIKTGTLGGYSAARAKDKMPPELKQAVGRLEGLMTGYLKSR